MKHLPLFIALILFIALTLISRQANAQFPDSGQLYRYNPIQPGPEYLMPSISVGALYPLHPGKVFSTQFQYQSTSASTGATTTHNFSGSSGAFYRTAILGDLIHVAYISHENYFDFGLGLNGDMTSTVGGYLKFGYGRILSFGRWQVQPTLDFYWTLDGPAKLGEINNKDTTISVLGFTAKPQFDVTSTDADGNTETDTYNAGKLEIDYKRNSFMAAPKVLLGTILWHRLYVGIEGGWMQQLWQTSTVKLTQYDEDDDGNTNGVGKMHLKPNGSLTGPEFALNIGWCFADKPKKKKP